MSPFPVGTSRTVPDIYSNPMRMRNCLRGILGIPRNERHKASPSLSDCRMARGAMAFVRGTIRQGTVSDAKTKASGLSSCARSAPLGSEIRRIYALARKSDGPDAPVSILSCIFVPSYAGNRRRTGAPDGPNLHESMMKRIARIAAVSAVLMGLALPRAVAQELVWGAYFDFSSITGNIRANSTGPSRCSAPGSLPNWA